MEEEVCMDKAPSIGDCGGGSICLVNVADFVRLLLRKESFFFADFGLNPTSCLLCSKKPGFDAVRSVGVVASVRGLPLGLGVGLVCLGGVSITRGEEVPEFLTGVREPGVLPPLTVPSRGLSTLGIERRGLSEIELVRPGLFVATTTTAFFESEVKLLSEAMAIVTFLLEKVGDFGGCRGLPSFPSIEALALVSGT